MIVRYPDTIKKFTIKDFDYFEDHSSIVSEEVDEIFGNSLVMLKGDKWRDMRSTLSPAFTGSKMRQMFDLIKDCANNLSEHYSELNDQESELSIDMKDLFSKYANDVIASSAFGIKVNSFKSPNNDFFIIGKKLVEFSGLKTIGKLILIKLLPKLMKALNVKFLEASVSNFFKEIVLNTMKVREKDGIFRPDMINMLMDIRKGSLEKNNQNEEKSEGFSTVHESIIGKTNIQRRWNDNEIVAQCFVFFAAGFRTSSTILSFAAYELAINNHIQERLRTEIIETNVNTNGKLSYDDLQNMKYMDMFVSEMLRHWPPGMFTDRICVKNYQYSDSNVKFTIEKGTVLWIPVYGLHHDPKYFPNPHIFDPERFNDQNKDQIVSGTYLPFGIGPRNCIGEFI